MKLSKKDAAVQRAIHRAVSSGKALGGLLVGLAATVVGCRENHSSAHTMGRFPDSRYQENATSETRNKRAIPGEPPVPQPAETNAVREKKGKEIALSGDVPPPEKREARQTHQK